METAFIVSPTRQEIELKPGETYEGSIIVASPAEATETLHYQVTVSPFSVTGTDYQPDFVTMSDWSKIVDWVKLEETSGTLEPNEKHRINYTIKVPSSVPGGGQYAMIGVSSTPTEKTSKMEIQNTFMLGSLIYAKVDGKTEHKGQILDNYIPGYVSSGTPTTIVTVRNDGNVHESVNVKLNIKNFFTGEEMPLSDQAKEGYESLIMPDSTRVLSRNLDNLPGLGLFTVSQDVSYLGETSELTTVMLICPVWFMVLSIITATAIIVAACYRIFFHRKKSPKKQLLFDKDDDKIDS